MMKKLTNETLIFVLGAVVVTIGVCYFLFGKKNVETMKHQALPPSHPAVQAQRQRKPTLVLFYADWCGNCTAMKPAWNEAADKLNGKVDTLKLDYETHKEEMKKAGIKGFPAMRLYSQGFPDGPYTDYKGDRSTNSIIDFALSN